MLDQTGMNMSKQHTIELFKVLDADKSGTLSIAEFKEFLFKDRSRDSKLM
jgi:Ca2+-binding EF-hand superfamily protein